MAFIRSFDAMCCFLSHLQCAHPNTHGWSTCILHRLFGAACFASHSDSMTTATIPLSYSFWALSMCWMSVRFLVFFCFHRGFGAVRRSLRHVACNACVKYVRLLESVQCVGIQFASEHQAEWMLLSVIDRISSDNFSFLSH